MRLLAPGLVSLLAIACAMAACGGDEAATPGDTITNGDAGGPGPTDDAGGSNTGDGAATLDGSSEAATGACSGKTGAAGNRIVDVTVGTTKRSFDLHVPPTYDPAKAMPLVFVFHGYTMTAASIAAASKFVASADAHGMIVAFPTGLNGGFNAGECCGASVTQKVDDLGFTRAMISSITKDYCVDPKRVYSTGFSNGGFMSYYLACEMSETFAAVASVAGTLGVPPADCKPKRPISLFHVHGTGDLVVPYLGGGVGANRSVAASVEAFRTFDSCPVGDGTTVYVKGDVSCDKWACAAGTHVELCSVTGGGHQWPGGEALPYGGSPSPNLETSEAIARFFLAHPLP